MTPQADGWNVPHLMRSEVVAEHLDVDVEVVNRLRRLGDLPGVRVGRSYRYLPEDVLAFLRERRDGATPSGEEAPAPRSEASG